MTRLRQLISRGRFDYLSAAKAFAARPLPRLRGADPASLLPCPLGSGEQDRRLRVAVIPEQFPGADGLRRVFILDYVEAIRPHCDVTVLLPGQEGRAGSPGGGGATASST